MSIQKTMEISREQAGQMWVDMITERNRKKLKEFIKSATNQGLEDELEETFYNYTITP